MQVLALPEMEDYGWCGLALFYMTDGAIWRVQLPRGKPVKLFAPPDQKDRVDLITNDRFVFAHNVRRGGGWLFARDGSLLHHAKPSFFINWQLTAVGLAVFDRVDKTVKTWPGGQTHTIVRGVYQLSTISTCLDTPVLYYGDNNYTVVNGEYVLLHDEAWEDEHPGCEAWELVPPRCPAYRGKRYDGIYMRDGYRAGLLALRRSGLPKELRWHIMNY
jgi:hypothetical protein